MRPSLTTIYLFRTPFSCFHIPKISSRYKLQPTPVLTNFTDFANRAYSPLVLGMILAAVESTDFE
jgi:hypothetical protein